MSKPRRQHYIPKSYLRNFAEIEDDDEKAFVEVMNVNTGEVKYPFSLSNVCVSKNLYTLPNVSEEDKFYLEYFYAQNIDAIYPEVYKILTNSKIIEITEEQRSKILNVCLSLYFRNARFLEEKNQELDFWLKRLSEQTKGEKDVNCSFDFGHRRYEFKGNEIENIREKVILANRTDFILSHMEDWQKFVHFKNNSQITVCRILGDVKLITSDNPVRIANYKKENFDLFDSKNSIQLPLDEEHLLWISSNDQEIERNMIYRGLRDKWFAITSNHTIQQDASHWIIGKQGRVIKYLEEDNKYNNFSPENVQAIEDIKTISTELTHFLDFARENGGITSEKSIAKLKELKRIPAFASDPQFQLICIELGL